MSSVQLRRYQLTPGSIDEFLASWRTATVVRAQYGFTVVFAVIDTEPEQFVWAVAHDGDFARAEAEYYASPERATLPVDPASFIAEKWITMVTPERVPGLD